MTFEDECDKLWQRTVEELLAEGATRAEAIEGANLVLLAYQRERRDRAAREAVPHSGTVARAPQYRARAAAGGPERGKEGQGS